MRYSDKWNAVDHRLQLLIESPEREHTAVADVIDEEFLESVYKEKRLKQSAG